MTFSSQEPSVDLVEAGRLLAVGHAEQEARAFSVEVEAGREVDGQRHMFGEVVDRAGEADLPQVWPDGKLDPERAGDLRRPHPGGADHDVRLDPADLVRHRFDHSVAHLDSRDGRPRRHRRAVPARAGRVSLHDCLRARVPVEGAERGADHSVQARERAELVHLVQRDEAARHAELVLEGNTLLECGDVLLAVEEEEVADLVEIDLGAGSFLEAGERFDAAQSERDVERVGELRAETSRRATGRTGGELVPLEEADGGPGLGEMERDARADDAAAHDDDVGLSGERSHRRTRLRRKKATLAGRSARRRMRYGYQSGPYGVATRTL